MPPPREDRLLWWGGLPFPCPFCLVNGKEAKDDRNAKCDVLIINTPSSLKSNLFLLCTGNKILKKGHVSLATPSLGILAKHVCVQTCVI